jgi:hypothetical protein
MKGMVSIVQTNKSEKVAKEILAERNISYCFQYNSLALMLDFAVVDMTLYEPF